MTIVSETIIEHSLTRKSGIGDKLGWSNWTHFGKVQGTTGIGLGHCSCNATVAIELNDDYESIDGDYSVVHGNSQIFRGLDPDNPGPDSPNKMFASSKQEQHAEQIAVKVACSVGTPWKYQDSCHLYIDLGPCTNCREWLVNHALPFKLYYTVKYEDAEKGHLERMHRQNRRHHKT